MSRELPSACIVGGGQASVAVTKCLCAHGFSSERYEVGRQAAGGSGGAGGTGDLAADGHDPVFDGRACRPDVTSDRRVCDVRRIDNGAWSVGLQSGDTRFFDAVVVTARPRMVTTTPLIAGADSFTGATLHLGGCDEGASLRAADVLVLGTGTSAASVAEDLAGYAGRVWLAPSPQRKNASSPPRAGTLARYQLFCSRAGRYFRRFTAVTGSTVRVVGEPVRIDGPKVHFAGGFSTRVDAIVYATGLSPLFGFLDPALTTAGGREFELYKRLFRPVIDSLLFVGSFLPARGASTAVAMQALLVAEYLKGTYALPDLPAMRGRSDHDHETGLVPAFAAVPGHVERTLARYAADLDDELKRGRRRALHNGGRPPLPVIAASLRPRSQPSKPAIDAGARLPPPKPGRKVGGPQHASGIVAA